MGEYHQENPVPIGERMAEHSGLLEWPRTDKCLLLLLTLLVPFGCLLAVSYSNLLAHTDRVALERAPLLATTCWFWFGVLGYVGLAIVGLFIRGRAPESRRFMHATLQFLWLNVAVGVYLIGPLTSPGGIAILGVWVITFALFEPYPVICAATVSFMALLGLSGASHLHWVPYAPLARAPIVDGLPSPFLLYVVGPLFFIWTVLALVFVGYLILRLRHRESELERLSSTDLLTKVNSRSRFEEALEAEFQRASRYGRKLSLLMLDVDRFKFVAERYGHGVGDQVLVSVAETLARSVRLSDVVGRYGGEEFVVLLPETDLKGARILAERCRAAIEIADVNPGNSSVISVTVSIGIATSNDEEFFSMQDLIERAESALYEAKERGRNCVVEAA